jgi:hypothetical protein
MNIIFNHREEVIHAAGIKAMLCRARGLEPSCACREILANVSPSCCPARQLPTVLDVQPVGSFLLGPDETDSEGGHTD